MKNPISAELFRCHTDQSPQDSQEQLEWSTANMGSSFSGSHPFQVLGWGHLWWDLHPLFF